MEDTDQSAVLFVAARVCSIHGQIHPQFPLFHIQINAYISFDTMQKRSFSISLRVILLHFSDKSIVSSKLTE